MPRWMPLPPRVEDKLAEAGASAYSWYLAELMEHLDPDGSARARSARISWALHLGAVVASSAVLTVTSRSALVAVAAVLYLVAALPSRSRRWVADGRGIAVFIVVAFTAAFSPSFVVGLGVLAATAVAVLVAAVLATRAARRGALLALLAAGTATGSATRLLAPGWASALVALIVGVAAAYGTAYLLQGKRAMPPWPLSRVPKELYGVSALPDPPVDVPLLLRREVRAFESRAREERKRGARSRFEANIDIKKIGAAAERSTGLLLLGMKAGRGTRIVHDVVIPGATKGGNVDHAVLAQSGLWVLDSKKYGTVADPGTVRHVGGGVIAHVSERGTRDLAPTLNTLAWAVRGLRNEMRVPARGLMVVHGADVQPGLSILVPGDFATGEVHVDVIAAHHLPAYLDTAEPIMVKGQVDRAAWGFQKKLTSATTGREPQMTKPVGGAPVIAGPSRARAMAPLTPPEPAHEAPDETSVDEEMAALLPTSTYSGEPLDELVERRIGERWAQIAESEPAAPDDVPDTLRGIRRGTPLRHTEISADMATVQSVRLVALSSPRQGSKGPIVWACDPLQWRIHQQTERPVMSTPFELKNLSVEGDA